MGNKPSIVSPTSRMAGPAPFIRNETRFFPQDTQIDLLCGQYSLNHILQEEKIVWKPGKPLLIGGANPLIPDVRINYWVVCNQHYERIKSILGKAVNAQTNFTSRCAMEPGERPGMFPIDSFAMVLDMLNLRNETVAGTRRNEDKANMRRALTEGFNTPTFLGVILTDSTHYIAIAKYTNACRGGYARIDSRFCIADGAECLSTADAIESAMNYMRNDGGAVLIFADRADSYPSVALQRMRAPVPAADPAPAAPNAAARKAAVRNAAERRRAAERNAATIGAASARNAATVAASGPQDDEQKEREKERSLFGEPSAPWKVLYNPKFKRVYYSNPNTGELTWNFKDTMSEEEKELEAALIASAPVPPQPWIIKYSIAKKRIFYFNPITKKSVYTVEEIKPAGGRRIRKTRRNRRSRNSTRARK